jgi:Tfp pilus assembly protein PilX
MNNFSCNSLDARQAPFHHIRGVVLPVVLVVLTVLTGLVVTQVRRSALDERLAANTRESVQMDSAVQTVLRWCEAALTVAPRNTVALAMDPNAATNPPPWRVAANWTTDTNSLNFTGTAAQLGLPNTNVNPACVIEDVTCDLIPAISETGL